MIGEYVLVNEWVLECRKLQEVTESSLFFMMHKDDSKLILKIWNLKCFNALAQDNLWLCKSNGIVSVWDLRKSYHVFLEMQDCTVLNFIFTGKHFTFATSPWPCLFISQFALLKGQFPAGPCLPLSCLGQARPEEAQTLAGADPARLSAPGALLSEAVTTGLEFFPPGNCSLQWRLSWRSPLFTKAQASRGWERAMKSWP